MPSARVFSLFGLLVVLAAGSVGCPDPMRDACESIKGGMPLVDAATALERAGYRAQGRGVHLELVWSRGKDVCTLTDGLRPLAEQTRPVPGTPTPPVTTPRVETIKYTKLGPDAH